MTNSDFASCADEQIATPGRIQPHGAMLVVDDDLTIVQASANVADHLGLSHDYLLDQTLGLAFPEELGAIEKAVEGLGVTSTEAAVVPLVGDDGKRRSVTLHRQGDRVILEIEPDPTTPASTSGARIREHLSSLRGAKTASLAARSLADSVRSLTGFDRVMVYRFDSEWNGQVVAESTTITHPLFMGVFFPSTDIPPQARELYRHKIVRTVPTVDYEPVEMRSTRPDVEVDMSRSELRSFSPRHLTYMRNMGVSASLSASIVFEGDLWGLIICHQYNGPFSVAPSVRTEVRALAELAGAVLPAREDDDAVHERNSALAMLAAITDDLSDSGIDAQSLAHHAPAIAQMVGASGVAISWKGQVVTAGQVPPERWFAGIAVRAAGSTVGFRSSHLVGEDHHYEEIAEVASGAMAIQIDRTGDSWLVWFRKENRVLRKWGGDPGAKTVVEQPDGTVVVEARTSFEGWSEILHNHSEPWHRHEMVVAKKLVQALAS